jgi:hypothetical protein
MPQRFGPRTRYFTPHEPSRSSGPEVLLIRFAAHGGRGRSLPRPPIVLARCFPAILSAPGTIRGRNYYRK